MGYSCSKDIDRSKKTVLVLSTSYPNSSDDWSGIFIHKLSSALIGLGYRITVLAPSNGEFYGERSFDGVTVRRFSYFWPRSLERLCSGAGGIPENLNKSTLARLQVFTMTLAFFFHAMRSSANTGVIYANWLGSGVVGALVGLFRGIPLVTSFRGDDGYLARERLLWRIFTKFVIRRSSALAPVSGELAEICKELGAPSAKVFTPRFGVDLELFRPSESPKRADAGVRIIYVGSLIPKKGVQDLLHAISGQSFNQAILDIVGEGFYAEDLKKLAGSLGISYRVNWRGLASPDEVSRFMRSSDILCLPSHTEGSPNVVKEAMSCGLPVVATRVGGVPDLVEDNQTGYLCGVSEIGDLSEKLKLLIDDPDLRQSFGANARKRILTLGMSWTSTAEEFHRIFQSVVENC